ncbi:hydrogenase expression protein HupH [Phreatobacter aquaticus]|uniref:Hydrogenase expression protein HupH n=1 Tax=Phreatobacter aquaticus TaxID=2570229 RepID=A0A4D7QJ48_9HYPH|nr:aspartate/glutamate racemase family protein [Phreatobacter aquaticus]QCK87528.1 hydrogenase expression protein HupH [Phreatobacter aquaticus]
MRLLLVNPNTNATTTDAMVAIAQDSSPDNQFVGLTAPFGVPLITGPDELAIAADAVATALAMRMPSGISAVIIAAFGDPGLEAAAASIRVPVVGIAEAAMAEAGHGDRRFAVVTTTPDLVASIAGLAGRYGHAETFLGTMLTKGDVHHVMADKERLVQALEAACHEAIATLGAEAIVIGGGPLAAAARVLASRLPVPLVEPIPAAVRLAERRVMFQQHKGGRRAE